MNKLKQTGYLLIILLISAASLNAQNSMNKDSLDLGNVIRDVISSHPTVKAAQEAINSADAGINMAKMGYYPDADATFSYSNIGPVIQLTVPQLGTIALYPSNNYNGSVNVRQTIYDFGRTKESVRMESENKTISEESLEQVKQKLSVYTVNVFYSLVYLQTAIGIKDEQINALNEHLSYVQKMFQTGSATEYQVLSTKVRISAIQNQKVDLLTALVTQQSYMNALLGAGEHAAPVVKNELKAEQPAVQADSMYSYAFANREEMIMNQKKTDLAELRYDMTRIQNRPLLNLQASAGGKNGYIPDENQIKANYVVGLGLRVPISDGLKNKYRLAQAKSAITSLSFEADNTRRMITGEITEAESNMNAAKQKVDQFTLQLSQAIKAYALADVSFRSGVITNLDLLDANTAVSESKLMLLKARIDYITSIYRLKAALGIKLY